MKQGTEITAARAREFGLEPQDKKESETAFRERIGGALREQGHFIEAHEAFNNQLYDEGGEDGPMTGIVGVMAQALSGVNYGGDGIHKIGHDIAAGTVASNPRKEMSPEMALLAIFMEDAQRRG